MNMQIFKIHSNKEAKKAIIKVVNFPRFYFLHLHFHKAYFFGKYCVTMRDETEWVELVDNGFNRLVGSNQAMIEDTYALLVDAPKTGFENRLYGNATARGISLYAEASVE